MAWKVNKEIELEKNNESRGKSKASEMTIGQEHDELAGKFEIL